MEHIKDIIKRMNIKGNITFGNSKDYIKIIRNYKLNDNTKDIKEVMSKYLDFDFWRLYTNKAKEVKDSYYPHNLIITFWNDEGEFEYHFLVKG